MEIVTRTPDSYANDPVDNSVENVWETPPQVCISAVDNSVVGGKFETTAA